MARDGGPHKGVVVFCNRYHSQYRGEKTWEMPYPPFTSGNLGNMPMSEYTNKQDSRSPEDKQEFLFEKNNTVTEMKNNED